MGPRSNSGFTLIELMIVVIITAVLLSYAVPGISRTMADRRAATVLSEIVRIGKRARAAAESGRPAHLVLIRPAGSGLTNGQGSVEMLRGSSARCDVQNWVAADAMCPPVPRALGVQELCPEYLDLSDAEWLHAPFEIRLRTVLAADKDNLPGLITGPANLPVSICYESSGVAYWSTQALGPAMTFSRLSAGDAAGGGFLFTVAAYNAGELQVSNVPRVVAFPLGAAPRRVR